MTAGTIATNSCSAVRQQTLGSSKMFLPRFTAVKIFQKWEDIPFSCYHKDIQMPDPQAAHWRMAPGVEMVDEFP